METKFILETGSNHNQSYQRSLQFISVAASIGCWGVKFQYYHADKLWSDPKRIAEAKKGELPLHWLKGLSEYAREKGLKFGCSVYHPDHVESVAEHCDFLKVSSFEANNKDLVGACMQTGIPTHVSFGIKLGWFNFAPPTVKYHCISRYPAKPEECNLDATFDNTYSGWSDHTANPGVIYNAVFGYHLSYIEFHLDLDGEGNEYKHGHCWLPNDMAEVIRNIKSGLEAEGTSNHNTVDKEREDLKDLMWKPETGKR